MSDTKIQAIFPCLNFYNSTELVQELEGFLTLLDKKNNKPFAQGKCILFQTSRSYYLRLFYNFEGNNVEMTFELGLLLNAKFTSESILEVCSEFKDSFVKENYKTQNKTDISEIVLTKNAKLGLSGFVRVPFNSLLIRISNAKRLKLG